jgi:hypothetical protein
MSRAQRRKWLLDIMPRFAGKLLDLVFLALVGVIQSVLVGGLTFIIRKLRCTTKFIFIGLPSMDLPQDQTTSLGLVEAIADLHELRLGKLPAI